MALALALVLAVSAAAAPVEARTVAKQAKRAAKKKCAKRHRCATVRRSRLARRAAAERLSDARPLMYGGPAPKRDRPAEDPEPGPALPSFVSVAAREFSLTLSRPVVGAGSVRIELRNTGEDPHNLVVSPDGTHSPLESFSELDPGAYERRSVSLSPGRYQLWCSIDTHEALGMSVTLRVQ